MSQRTVVSVLVAGALVAAGCAQPPTPEIDAAKSALETARTAEAPEYAFDEWTAAEEAQTLLFDELTTQESKFAPLRNYDAATRLAQQAGTAANLAADASAAEKARLRALVADLIATTRFELTSVQQMLSSAPRGKGSEADLAALNADLVQVEGAISTVETALQEGELKEAQTKVEAAFQLVSSVRLAIEEAQVRASGGPRRS